MLLSLNCGCLEVKPDGNRLPEGMRVLLPPEKTIEIELAARLPAAPSRRTLSALFDVTSAPAPRYELRWNVDVVANVQATPARLDDRFKRGDGVRTHQVTLTRHSREAPSDRPPVIVNPPPDWLRVAKIERSQSASELDSGLWQDQWTATVEIEPAESGSRHASLRLRFEGSPPAEFDLPVHALPVHGVEAPKYVFFGAREEAQVRKVLVRSCDDQPFSIRSIRSTSPDVSVAAVPKGRASRHWFEVVYRRSGAEKLDSRLDIVTDHPDSPRLVVRVVGGGARR